jgi:hypothetical protein
VEIERGAVNGLGLFSARQGCNSAQPKMLGTKLGGVQTLNRYVDMVYTLFEGVADAATVKNCLLP